MKRTLIGGAVLIAFFGGTTLIKSIHVDPIVYVRTAEAKEVEVEALIEWTPERIDQEIADQADAFGASAAVMRKVIQCESMGSTTIQSYHRRPDGSREQSFGLAQIYLPAHPDVTIEEATDPQFAISFMAKEMAAGNAWKWTCWKQMQ